MRAKILTIHIFILFLSATFVMAQKDNAVKDKLDNIKGEVNKIVISTENGDVTFEGDEAKTIFKKMKSEKIKRLRLISEDDVDIDLDDDEDVLIFKSGKGGKHIIREFKDSENVILMQHGDDEDFDGKIVKVEVEDENDEKKVTVTTSEDGEEKVETFEGKEADDYLANMESEHDMSIDLDSDYGDNIGKDVKIEINDGVKKITETITENGEKSVKVYEGEDAEKYLKEINEKEKRIKIKHKMKDGKRFKKVIIKENVEKE